MGDRDKGKRKVDEHYEVGESSGKGSRNTRVRTLGGDDPLADASPPRLIRQDGQSDMSPGQQRTAAESGGEEGGRVGRETQDLISQIDRPQQWTRGPMSWGRGPITHGEMLMGPMSQGGRRFLHPGLGRRPVTRAELLAALATIRPPVLNYRAVAPPSSSQLSSALQGMQGRCTSEVHPRAIMHPQPLADPPPRPPLPPQSSGVSGQSPRPQAPPSSSQGPTGEQPGVVPLFPRARLSDLQPQARVRAPRPRQNTRRSTAVANQHGGQMGQQLDVAPLFPRARLSDFQPQPRVRAPRPGQNTRRSTAVANQHGGPVRQQPDVAPLFPRARLSDFQPQASVRAPRLGQNTQRSTAVANQYGGPMRQQPDVAPLFPRARLSDFQPQASVRAPRPGQNTWRSTAVANQHSGQMGQQPDVAPLFPRAHLSDFQPQASVCAPRPGQNTRSSTAVSNQHGGPMRQQRGGAQRGDTYRLGEHRPGLQGQARASVPASQPVAATGASGSSFNLSLSLSLSPPQPHPHRLPQQHQPPPRLAAAANQHSLLMGQQRGDAPGRSAFQPWHPGLQGRPQAHPIPRFAGHPLEAWGAMGIFLVQPVPIPDELRCPVCRVYPGWIAQHPPQHVCLCDFCRFNGVVCQVCAPAQAVAGQGDV